MKRFLMYGIPKSLLIKIILFLLILLGAKNVFAYEIDVTNNVTSPGSSGTGKYYGTEILNTGTQATYNVNTRYQGKLSRIIYNLPLPSELGQCFTTNVNYKVTMYMATNDWNNAFGSVKVRPYSSSSTNWSNGSVTFVSYKKIYFSFKIPSSDTTCYDFVWVDLPSTNLSNTGITQISNWNLSKITLDDPTISSGGGSGGSGTSPTPTSDPNQTIINNQNENTQNIIDNQNENTNNIIENNNQNTQNIIDNENNNNYTCGSGRTIKLTPMVEGSFINSSTDQLSSNSNFNVSNYIYIKGGESYTISFNNITDMEWGYFCWYHNDTVISCVRYNQLPNYSVLPFNLTAPENANKVKFTYRKDSNATIKGYICTNKSDSTTDAINNLNDTMKDESVPNIDIDIDVASDTPIIDLIYMPFNFIEKLLDLSDNSCQPYVLPFDFFGGNNTLTLPCINIKDYVGNDFYNIINAIISFYMAYNIGLMCITIYNDITSVRDGFRHLYFSNDPDVVGYGKE